MARHRFKQLPPVTAIRAIRTIKTINTLGDEVARRAGMLGLTLTELAARIGIHQTRLAHIVEKPMVTERAFHAICRGLGIQPAEWDDWDELFGRKASTLQLARQMRRNVTLGEKNERPKKRSGRQRSRC